MKSKNNKIISIDLRSDFAFFKNPQFNGEINSKQYSFDCIHKISIMGILGRIIGLKGLKNSENMFPEFYEKLKGIEIGIKIINPIRKIWETTNSSSALFSKESGGNLTIKRELLVKPKYRIYLKLNLENKIDNIIYDSLKKNKIPYFGYIYFGRSKFKIIKNNFTEYNYTKQDNFSGNVETIFKSSYEIEKTILDNTEKDSIYNVGYIFEKNSTDKYERNISIPTKLKNLYKKEIGYESFDEFTLTNKKVIINETKDENIYKIDDYAICLH